MCVLAKPIIPASVVVALFCSIPVAAVAGEESGAPAPTASDSASGKHNTVRPGPLPTLAAVVPGLVLHGSGLFVAGDKKGALFLLEAEGIGAAMFVGGAGTLVLTGVSRYLAGPLIALTVTGGGVFLVSGLADLYGAAGGARLGYAPERRKPWVEVESGLGHVYDPLFGSREFAVLGATLRFSRLRISPSAWASLDRLNVLERLDLGWRMVGPLANSQHRATDGSFLDFVSASSRHRFRPEGFTTLTHELAIAGRYDLRRASPLLAGTYVELELGGALAETNYDWSYAADHDLLLLSRFGVGVYLGRPGGPHGEVSVYYDHRHDGMVGGLAMDSMLNGIPGRVGTDARLRLVGPFGVALGFAVGSAYAGSLRLVWTDGGDT